MTGIPLVIVGAGGFGREVHDVVEAINQECSPTGYPRYELAGWVDDGQPDARLLRGAPHLGGVDVLDGLPKDCRYVVGIGDGAVRRKVDEQATAAGLQAATLIHPRATLGRHRVELGPGCVICAGAMITTDATLGRHVHLNLQVTVGHDTVIGDYVTVSPHVGISGTVIVEDGATIGSGAQIIPGVTVGAGATIGAGAAVVRSIPPGATAVGVPARPR